MQYDLVSFLRVITMSVSRQLFKQHQHSAKQAVDVNEDRFLSFSLFSQRIFVF